MHPSNAECSGLGAWPKKLETKASSQSGQCIPAGSGVRLPRSVLITMSIITMPCISRKLCVRLFTLCKIFIAFCESCGASYRRICEMFSALQSTSDPVTDVENRVQIDAYLATLFPQTGTKLTKNAVINLALCCGAI